MATGNMRPFFATKMLFLMRLKCFIKHLFFLPQKIGSFPPKFPGKKKSVIHTFSRKMRSTNLQEIKGRGDKKITNLLDRNFDVLKTNFTIENL